MSVNKQHFEKIDFLRGIAIILVFFFHSYSIYFRADGYNKAGIIDISGIKKYIINFSPFAFGWSGVTLFLIISGFLIHLGYLRGGANFRFRTFYSKRFWRIYPAYLIVLILASCFVDVDIFTSKEGQADFLLHFFCLHNLFEHSFFTINPSFWSLALEIQLYLAYPALLYLRRLAGIRNTFIIILSFSFLLLAAGIVFKDLGDKVSYRNSVFMLWFIWAAGALLAELYTEGKRMFQRHALLISGVSFLMLIGARYFLYSNLLSQYIATLGWIAFFDWVFHTERIKMTGFFCKMLVTTGLISYSMYLIHEPVLMILLRAFGDFFMRYPSFRWFFVPFGLALTFVLSYISYRLIEIPAIGIGGRLRMATREKAAI